MDAPSQHAVRNRLLKAMTGSDFTRLAPHLERVDLPLQQMLIAPGEPIDCLYFPESGLSSITAESGERKVEVGMIGREGLVGASPVLLGVNHVPHRHFIQLAGDGFRIAAEAFSAAVDEHASLRRLLLRYVQTEIVQVRQTAFANASLTIEARLARWLLMCLDRVDGDELPLKHEFLSVMLGVQRSGVTLALQVLEGAGRIRGRRMRIQVRDRAGLEAVANGSYGEAEAEYARLIEGA